MNDDKTAPTYLQPEHGWTCFHCGETFTTPGGARDHFGESPNAMPGCAIKVALGDERGGLMALRRLEKDAGFPLTRDCLDALLRMIPAEVATRSGITPECNGSCWWGAPHGGPCPKPSRITPRKPPGDMVTEVERIGNVTGNKLLIRAGEWLRAERGLASGITPSGDLEAAFDAFKARHPGYSPDERVMQHAAFMAGAAASAPTGDGAKAWWETRRRNNEWHPHDPEQDVLAAYEAGAAASAPSLDETNDSDEAFDDWFADRPVPVEDEPTDLKPYRHAKAAWREARERVRCAASAPTLPSELEIAEAVTSVSHVTGAEPRIIARAVLALLSTKEADRHG